MIITTVSPGKNWIMSHFRWGFLQIVSTKGLPRKGESRRSAEGHHRMAMTFAPGDEVVVDDGYLHRFVCEEVNSIRKA